MVNTITWPLLYLHIQDNRILRKMVPVTWTMGSYIVPKTIKISVNFKILCRTFFRNIWRIGILLRAFKLLVGGAFDTNGGRTKEKEAGLHSVEAWIIVEVYARNCKGWFLEYDCRVS